MGFQNLGTVRSSGISFRGTSQAVRATLLATPLFCFQLAQWLEPMFPKRDSLSMQPQLWLFVKLQIGLLVLQSGYLGLFWYKLASDYACNYVSSLTGVPMKTFSKGSNHSLSPWHPRTDPNSSTLYPPNRVRELRCKPWICYALTFVTKLCAFRYSDMTFNFTIAVEIVLPKITRQVSFCLISKGRWAPCRDHLPVLN